MDAVTENVPPLIVSVTDDLSITIINGVTQHSFNMGVYTLPLQ